MAKQAPARKPAQTPPPPPPAAAARTPIVDLPAPIPEADAIRLRMSAAALAHLERHDLALMRHHLLGKSLTAHLGRTGEQGFLAYERAIREGHLPHEAEAIAREEVCLETQMGAPLQPEAERKEALALLAEWKKSPEAAPFVG